MYALGALVGVTIGSQFVMTIPENIYRTIIGLFVLIMTWLPKTKFVPRVRGKFFYVGAVITFLSLFVGATGGLSAPFFLREKFGRFMLVATKAACQVFTHIFKVATFIALGFSFAPYWKLLVGMLVAVFFGTLL